MNERRALPAGSPTPGRRLPLGLLLVLLAAAAACEEAGGGAAVRPTEPDPGSGTGTLGVVVTISANEAIAPARREGDLDTWVEARVTRYDEPVLDATVTLATDSGDKPLGVDDDGVYRGSHAGYHRVYGLHVEAGPDVVDAVVVGPTLQLLTAPELPWEAPTLPLEGPIEVAWQAADPAEAVRVRVGDFTADELPDTGAYTVPADAPRGAPGAEVRVEVRREVRMGLAGGAAGSEAVVSVRNRTRPARLCPGDGCP